MDNMETNKIYCGDCLEIMRTFPSESIDMIMTSPPYWGLRDYGIEQIFGGDKDCEHGWDLNPTEHDNLRYRGHTANVGSNKNPEIHPGKQESGGQDCIYCGAWKGQIGLEPTPELYIEHLTEIFNEVKRVLKKGGTLWLNIGDTYGGDSPVRKSGAEQFDPEKQAVLKKSVGGIRRGASYKEIGTIPKCLSMIPERLAFSLIQHGWILRNKNIWHKRNAMPSSVTDRFSNTYEFVYMFSKNQRYYFDLDAVRELVNYPDRIYNPDTSRHKTSKLDSRCTGGLHDGRTEYNNPFGKNPGDVFEINTQPFPEAHFAVFPEKLCEKPIKAGCPEGVCKKCGRARERIVEQYDIGGIQKMPDYWDVDLGSHGTIHRKGRTKGEVGIPIMANKTIGWTSCKCNAGFEGGIVLDPFAGAGTALYVAKEMKRRYIGIDIKQEYCDMCEKRLAQGVL